MSAIIKNSNAVIWEPEEFINKDYLINLSKEELIEWLMEVIQDNKDLLNELHREAANINQFLKNNL